MLSEYIHQLEENLQLASSMQTGMAKIISESENNLIDQTKKFGIFPSHLNIFLHNTTSIASKYVFGLLLCIRTEAVCLEALSKSLSLSACIHTLLL